MAKLNGLCKRYTIIWHYLNSQLKGPQGFPGASTGKESACNAGDLGLILGLGISPGERKDCPIQYSGLENSMDYIVHGVAKKSQTQLIDFYFHFHINPKT